MKTFNITEARKNLLTLVKKAKEEGQYYEITVKGEPTAVVLSMADYENLCETLAILSDQDILKDIVTSKKQIAKGETVSLEDLL